MKYSGHYRELLCELSKLSKFNAFNPLGYKTYTDESILVYRFRPERTFFFITVFHKSGITRQERIVFEETKTTLFPHCFSDKSLGTL